jgi:DNA invertase Pin-like site-specific DNA recombinase
MAVVHGYIRPTPTKQVQSVDAQKEAIRRYCRANALLQSDVGPPGPAEPYWYVDQSGSGKHMLSQRTAGRVLYRNLERGDHVVITTLDRAFRRLSDSVDMLEDFRRRDIRLHVCDMLGHPFDVSRFATPAMLQILQTFGGLERASRAEHTGEDSRDRRARGLGLGRPRLGFKYVSRVRTLADGRKRRFLQQENDPEERAVMKLILGWRREAPRRSWDEIRQTLNYELKLRTRSGAEWSTARIRRACKAETILELLEARGCRPADVFVVLGRLADRTPATDEGREPVGESG